MDDALYATAADLARLYRVSQGTIYGWASKDHWRRTGVFRPRGYSREDAHKSWERRYPQHARST